MALVRLRVQKKMGKKLMSEKIPSYRGVMDYRAWMKNLNASKPQFLHTMMRVKNLDATLRFYVDGLGMKILDCVEIESRRVTALFVGFDVSASLELVHPWDAETAFTHGSGYGHVAIGVPDVTSLVVKLEGMGFEITTRPVMVTETSPLVAFVKDPEGYAIELTQIKNP
jgi:lactoylglutathione lyase